jgi:hypothetical protein
MLKIGTMKGWKVLENTPMCQKVRNECEWKLYKCNYYIFIQPGNTMLKIGTMEGWNVLENTPMCHRVGAE